MLRDILPYMKGEQLISYQLLRDFIRTELILRPVGNGTEFLHKISASICRTWFKNDDYDGWRYPSVHFAKNKNIAVKPDRAHKKLKINKIEIVMMTPSDLLSNVYSSEDSPFVKMYEKAYSIRHLYEGQINGESVEWNITSNGNHRSFIK